MLGVPRDTNTYILFHEILFYKIRNHHYKVINPPKYRLHAIISSGLNIHIFFTPFFSMVYNQERLLLQTIHEKTRKCGPKIHDL